MIISRGKQKKLTEEPAAFAILPVLISFEAIWN